MSPRARRLLVAMVGVGVGIRLLLAFATVGSEYDMKSFEVVAAELSSPADLYSRVNQELVVGELSGILYRWPYAPGFLPWVYLSDWTADNTGIALHGLVQLPAIAADIAIALLVVYGLRRRGASERTLLAAAGLVLLGPLFIAISGYHGQFDSLAILPALAAALLWEQVTGRRRALFAGLLLGAGAALKTVPAIMVLALLPTARSPGEGVRLAALTAAVPLAMLAPFAIADFAGVRELANYSGAPGAGGLSLVLQPDLANRWLTEEPFQFSGATELLTDYGSLLLGAALLVLTAILIPLRTPPVTAAICVWLVVWTLGPGFFLQYLVWGVPFIILAGRLVEAAALQVAVLVPILLFYLGPWESSDLIYVYAPIMIAVWVAMLVALAAVGRRFHSRGRPLAT